MKEKQIKRNAVYTCDFLEVFEDDVLLPSKEEGKRVVIEHIGAAAVLPLLSTGEVVLIKQYRYSVDAYMLEIPAGKKDFKEELGIDCAMRELEEEANLVSEDVCLLAKVHTAIGFTDEMIEVFVAYDCTFKAEAREVDPDEYIELVKVPLSEAKAMARDGRITDAKTVVALLMIEK